MAQADEIDVENYSKDLLISSLKEAELSQREGLLKELNLDVGELELHKYGNESRIELNLHHTFGSLKDETLIDLLTEHKKKCIYAPPREIKLTSYCRGELTGEDVESGSPFNIFSFSSPQRNLCAYTEEGIELIDKYMQQEILIGKSNL